MSGWKTWLAAGLSIVYGTAGILAGLHDSATGVEFIVQGLGLLGIGHKIDKAGLVK